MKKILFIISIFFLSLLNIKATAVPNNIYYINDGLYAYLEENDITLSENEKLYIEYRIDDVSLELIEVKEQQNIIFLTDTIDSKNILIDSRFVIYGDDYTYLDWSNKEKVDEFDFKDKPEIKIDNLKYDKHFTYDILNKKEIEEYFKIYKKIYDLDITYKEEYGINGEYTDKLSEDLTDIKLNFRVYYEVGDIKSNYSNVLVYENHPPVCLFDSNFCCNQIFGISICIFIIILSVIVISILIIIDKKYRLKKEA